MHPVASGTGREQTTPDDTLQGVTPERKKFVVEFTKNSGYNKVGKVKKVWSDRLQWGDTRVKLIKVTVSDAFWQEK